MSDKMLKPTQTNDKPKGLLQFFRELLPPIKEVMEKAIKDIFSMPNQDAGAAGTQIGRSSTSTYTHL